MFSGQPISVGFKKLFDSIDQKNHFKLNFCLGITPIPDLYNLEGETLLTKAIKSSFLEAVLVLLKYEASVNLPNTKRETPLLLAVKNQEVEILEVLLRAKADPNIRDANNETALIVAVKLGHYAVVQKLIFYKADIFLRHLNKNALDYAVEAINGISKSMKNLEEKDQFETEPYSTLEAQSINTQEIILLLQRKYSLARARFLITLNNHFANYGKWETQKLKNDSGIFREYFAFQIKNMAYNGVCLSQAMFEYLSQIIPEEMAQVFSNDDGLPIILVEIWDQRVIGIFSKVNKFEELRVLSPLENKHPGLFFKPKLFIGEITPQEKSKINRTQESDSGKSLNPLS